MMMGKATLILAMAVLGLCLSNGQAGIIALSQYSSDETLAEVLRATVEFSFSVTDSTLTIVVSNLTDGPGGGEDASYDIMALYFNATSNVNTLTSPSEWALSSDTKADGFGYFDYVLTDDTPNKSNVIEGGTFKTFTLTATGTGIIDESNFYTKLSSNSPGNLPMLVAAKFFRGPNDDSAFGAVPEPATVFLLGLGALNFIRKKRIV